MSIINWCKKYADTEFNEISAKDSVDGFIAALGDKKIVFYGAKITAGSMYRLLKEIGLDVSEIIMVDRNYKEIKELNGIDVHEPAWLKTLKTGSLYVLTTVDPYNRESVLNDINKLGLNFYEIADGHYIHSILQRAWCTNKIFRNEQLDLRTCMDCSIMKLTCNVLKTYLMRLMNFDYEKAFGTDSQKSIGYSLGGVCTLKCKDCHEMTPYATASRRKFVPKEIYVKDMKKILGSCKFVTTLELVGGEPFAHPELYDIIKETIPLPNLGFIHVFSNGTIIPSDDICKILKNPRIAVTLTNFAERLSQEQRSIFEQVKAKMKEFDIQYIVRFLTTWQDANSFEFVDDDEQTLKKRFSECRFNSCRRLANGIMYICQHDYAGDLTGKFPLIDNQINIHNFDKDKLSEELDEFNTREYFNICNYCPLPDRTKAIPAAIQL